MASLVPCGMASSLPMYVDTDFSRSCIASTYAGLDGAAGDQELARLGDRVVARGCRTGQHDRVDGEYVDRACLLLRAWIGHVVRGSRGRLGVGVGLLEQVDDLVVLAGCHEVVDGDVQRGGRLLLGPFGEVAVGDDQVRRCR